MLDRTSPSVGHALGPEFTLATEAYGAIVDEVRPLLPGHWEELAVYKDIPLDPAWDFYEGMDKLGALKIFTVRKSGALIGYSIFAVRPRHAHYNFAWAMNDIVRIEPEHRNFGVGRALVDYWDAELAAMGVAIVHVNAKVQHPELMYLLKACGYETIECGMQKRLR